MGDRYRVIAPDLPGHGGAAGPFTLDRAVDAARAVSADAGGVHLVGISGGATYAVHLWNLQQPELFNETVAEFVARSSDQTPRLGGGWLTQVRDSRAPSC